MKTTCIIVEDEPASQDILKQYITDCPGLDLVAICNNAIEALALLQKQKVQLIFLDITMPRLSGLDFYRSLPDPPHVIFTTAYPEYAVDGFEVNAVDYLVKPFPFDRFLKAVNKLQQLQKNAGEGSEPYIMLTADKKIHKVNYDDILYLEAMGDYVKVHTKERVIIVHNTLQKLHEQLPPQQFIRTHKSFLISRQHIDYIEGNMIIIHQQTIPIGQTYRNDFLSLLNKRN